MATGLDLFKAALKEIGVLAIGETPNDDMGTDAESTCNRMLSGWANRGRKVYEIFDETQTMTAATASFTIGSGGDWNTTWPTKIMSIKVRDSNGNDYPCTEISTEEYQNITDKDATSSRPYKWTYDKTYPLGVIKFYPVHTGALTALITSLKQFTALTKAGTVSLPPGYEELIVFHLAKRLCPGYSKKITADLKALCWEAEQGIKQVNKKHDKRSVDTALVKGAGGYYDINIGTYT
jgi:hypothetical protein